MIYKTLFMLFLLASLSFAAWESVAALAIVTSLMFIILVYVIGNGFNIEMLKVTAKDEMYQLIALAFLMVILFGANNIIDTFSTAQELVDAGLTGKDANMQTTAMLSINHTLENMSKVYGSIVSIDNAAGKEASQGVSCNLQGMGYFVSGCGGFSMLASPFSLAGSIMGFAIGELNAIYKLIDVSSSYALSLLLPLGIILRTFRITRGAGGFLIAMGISMHLLLPVGILFVDMLGDSFLASDYAAGYESATSLGSIDPSCRPGDTGDYNSNEAIDVYNGLRGDMKSFMFLVLIKATLGPVISVLMMISGIRFLSAIAGAEVDVSALARVV